MGSTALDFRALMKKERQAACAAAKKHREESPLLLASREPVNLSSCQVGPIREVAYVHDFLTEEEAERLLAAIDQAPQSRWTQLTNRRLQNLGGTPSSQGMVPQPLPPYATATINLLLQAGIFPTTDIPNHILLNSYEEGQGIAPHKDGPLYDSKVAIISLGSPADLHFWSSNDPASPPAATYRLEDRSLLVFSGPAFENFWHGILPSNQPGARRVSLTVRRVKKVVEQREVIETEERRREAERAGRQFLRSINEG